MENFGFYPQFVKILIFRPLAVCIMAASASATHATRWSSCSEERLKGIQNRFMNHDPLFTNHLDRIHDPENKGTSWPCLDDTPESSIIYGEPVCGNGLLEKGEVVSASSTSVDYKFALDGGDVVYRLNSEADANPFTTSLFKNFKLSKTLY